MNPANKIKTMLMDDIHEMASHPECFTKHPDKDFTRNRKLSTEDVTWKETFKRLQMIIQDIPGLQS